jgi:formylglycine-generating enzyme
MNDKMSKRILVLVFLIIGSCAKHRADKPANNESPAASAEPISNRERIVSWFGLVFVPVPAGTYELGAINLEETTLGEHHRYKATLSHDYWIAETEVTQQQWELVMNTRPWLERKQPESIGDRLPANCITWHAAKEFCQKIDSYERMSGRIPDSYVIDLPSEAEWEVACRAGAESAFCFGNDLERLSSFAVHRGNSGLKLAVVASKKPNRYGIFDMHGNAQEWCVDEYNRNRVGGIDPIQKRAAGRTGAPLRPVRGGSAWHEGGYCSSWRREFDSPDRSNNGSGFRPAIVRR